MLPPIELRAKDRMSEMPREAGLKPQIQITTEPVMTIQTSVSRTNFMAEPFL
jgi:hypothetical protein